MKQAENKNYKITFKSYGIIRYKNTENGTYS